MMGPSLLAWALALILGTLAAALYARLRSMTIEIGEAKVSVEKLEGELRASRAQLEREAAKLRRKSDELAELRKRHDKLKKRAEGGGSKSGSDRPELGGAAGERVLEQARQERDRAREAAETLAGELETVRNELQAAHAAVEAARPDEGSLSPEAAMALREEVERAQAALAESGSAVLKAEEQVARLKRRLEAQETAYVALRGELEAKKDRLATQAEQIERLRALKVVLGDAHDEGAAGVGAADGAAHGAAAGFEDAPGAEGAEAADVDEAADASGESDDAHFKP